MAHYLDNAALREELIKAKQTGRLSPAALQSFILLCQRISNKYYYKREEDRADCVAVAVSDCYRYYKNFNPDANTSAFSFMTSIAHNGLRKGWASLYGGKSPLKDPLNRVSLAELTNNRDILGHDCY